MRLSRLLAALVLLFVAVAASGDPLIWPTWLQNDGDASTSDGGAAPSTTWMQGDDSSPVTIAQLEFVAESASDYLAGELSSTGGAGSEIENLVAGFTDSDDSTPVTVAQLQAVAQPFYDRLIAAGFDTQASLAANGAGADWASDYPWAQPPPGPEDPNYDASAYAAWQQAQDAPANLGQLNLAFSFDLGDSTQTTLFDISTSSNAAAVSSASNASSAPTTATAASPAGGDAAGDAASAALADSPVVADDAAAAPATPDASSVALRILTPLE